MKQFMLKHKKAAGAIAVCLMIGGITLSFQDTPFVNQILNEEKKKDTVPGKKYHEGMTMKEFDNLSKELDKHMLDVADQLKKIDMEAILKQSELAMKAIDVDKIMKEVELSIKDINIEKISAEAMASVKEIDLGSHTEEIEKAMKKAKEELEQAKVEMKKINTEEIKKEMENAKIELEKSKTELDKTRKELKELDMDKIMKEAKEGMSMAKSELKDLKTMFNEMEADGLVDSKKGFKIEYKGKDLYIDGQKQPQTVTDKYRKYFNDDNFEIEIKKEK